MAHWYSHTDTENRGKVTSKSVSDFIFTHYCDIQVTVMEKMGKGGGQWDGFTKEWKRKPSESAVSKRKALWHNRRDH